MPGPTETTRGPELAPDGIVIMMDVPLHELIVTGLPFSTTTLFPCVVPKLEPVITTRLPIDPVVADRLAITGAGEPVELTETLSKVAVARLALSLLLTARPTYVFVAIVIVWLVPTCVQFTPSDDAYPLKVLPLLTAFTQ